jgi:hypothetical protein
VLQGVDLSVAEGLITWSSDLTAPASRPCCG